MISAFIHTNHQYHTLEVLYFYPYQFVAQENSYFDTSVGLTLFAHYSYYISLSCKLHIFEWVINVSFKLDVCNSFVCTSLHINKLWVYTSKFYLIILMYTIKMVSQFDHLSLLFFDKLFRRQGIYFLTCKSITIRFGIFI